MFLSLFSVIKNPLLLLAIMAAYLSALFICMPFHEFAHAHAALKEGDYTSKALNRYTLAPFAHVDGMGLVMLLFFGFGFAKPVPVDSRNFKRGKRSSLRVAFAGVLVNLLIGVISCFVYVLLYNVWPALFYKYGVISEMYTFFFNFMISLNFSFAFFNLLPIYPLDGYRIVDACSKTDNSFLRFVRIYSFWIMLFLLLSGILNIILGGAVGLISNFLIDVFQKVINFIVGLF